MNKIKKYNVFLSDEFKDHYPQYSKALLEYYADKNSDSAKIRGVIKEINIIDIYVPELMVNVTLDPGKYCRISTEDANRAIAMALKSRLSRIKFKDCDKISDNHIEHLVAKVKRNWNIHTATTPASFGSVKENISYYVGSNEKKLYFKIIAVYGGIPNQVFEIDDLTMAETFSHKRENELQWPDTFNILSLFGGCSLEYDDSQYAMSEDRWKTLSSCQDFVPNIARFYKETKAEIAKCGKDWTNTFKSRFNNVKRLRDSFHIVAVNFSTATISDIERLLVNVEPDFNAKLDSNLKQYEHMLSDDAEKCIMAKCLRDNCTCAYYMCSTICRNDAVAVLVIINLDLPTEQLSKEMDTIIHEAIAEYHTKLNEQRAELQQEE